MIEPGEATAREAGPSSNEGSRAYVYMVCAVAAIGGLLFGFDTAIISGAIDFVKAEFTLNEHQEGFVVSCLLIGCILGAASAGVISDALGRKRVLIVTAVMYAASAIWSGLPQSVGQLIAARFLGGLAVGVSSMIAPMYIAEIAPARIRGALVTLQQMAIVTGILMAYVVNKSLADIGSDNWRWMFASEALPAMVLLIGLFFVPESPRWLAKQGRDDRARRILSRVGGLDHADTELIEIRAALAQEEGRLGELLRPGLRTALVIGIVLTILSQVSGINTVIYYAPKIFHAAGLGQGSGLSATVLVGVTNFVVTIVSLLIIDHVGRKPLLLFGAGCMTVSMALAATILRMPDVSPLFKVGVILTYIMGFGVGVGGVVWVIISEVFPTKIRGRAVSIATTSVWSACFVVAQTFPYLLKQLEENVFWIYGALSAVMFIFVLVVVPETRGKTLEEIERMWRRAAGPCQCRNCGGTIENPTAAYCPTCGTPL